MERKIIMIECSINNLIKYYGANKIFENISFELKTNERIGLIGKNGCGKTTLMKILIGAEDYQGGSINFSKDTKVGYLDQIFEFKPDTTVMEIFELAFQKLWEIKKEMKSVEQKIKKLKGGNLDKVLKRYGYLMEQYEINGGYEVETRINKIYNGLNIADSYRKMRFEELSGGEKTRVMLGKLLLEEPDILLMDEPTNHLDISSVEWLEEFLKNYKGVVLVISHDRCFLDNVVNRIIELHSDKAELYDGNYSDYTAERERRFLLEYKAYQNQQKKIDTMEKQVQRFRIWGKMRDSEVMYKRAKEIEKRLGKIEVLDRPVLESRKIRLPHQKAQRSGKIVLKAEMIEKSFGEKMLFSDLSFTLFYQDRLCIMGNNGSGKTTLLKIILGKIPADKGCVSLGASIKIGYLPQNVIFRDEEKTLLEYFIEEHKVTVSEARSELAKVLYFQEDVNKKIRTLSGGEKRRLKLCSLLYEEVNFMILDEPTNHLDMDSREVLEETLTDYDGTLLFVSHDRYFIRKIADKIMVLDNGNGKLYPMNYDEYLEEKKKDLEVEFPKENIKEVRKTPEKKVKMPDKNQKLKKLEEEMNSIEEKLNLIDELMNLNNSNAVRLSELFNEKETLEMQFEEVFLEWEKLQ
ncbi:ribosomal protection-like ABC-F family protein [Acidilutibacter cellobiosedens]|nr:ABC-F type ribosomal protection protein [Acidilutibacter cellobiosedens]